MHSKMLSEWVIVVEPEVGIFLEISLWWDYGDYNVHLLCNRLVCWEWFSSVSSPKQHTTGRHVVIH